MFIDSALDSQFTLGDSGTFTFSTSFPGAMLVTVTEEVSGHVALFMLTAATLALVVSSDASIVVGASPTSGQIGVSLAVNSGTANVVSIKTGSGTTGTFPVDHVEYAQLTGAILQ